MKEEQIRLIRAALEQLEVRGERNLSLLLGCLQALSGLEEGEKHDRKYDPGADRPQ